MNKRLDYGRLWLLASLKFHPQACTDIALAGAVASRNLFVIEKTRTTLVENKRQAETNPGVVGILGIAGDDHWICRRIVEKTGGDLRRNILEFMPPSDLEAGNEDTPIRAVTAGELRADLRSDRR